MAECQLTLRSARQEGEDLRPAPSPADMKETWADIANAKRVLGWKPEISPENGFRKTVDWHAANRLWLGNVKL